MTLAKMRHILWPPREGAKRLLYRMLSWLPLPAQDKWKGSLQLVRIQVRLLPRLAEEKLDPAEGELMAKKSLYQAGKQLIINRFDWSSPPQRDIHLVEDTYSVLFKTLNLPSVVTGDQEKVTITTFFCPFLEDARAAHEDGPAVCQRVCGRRRSLFKGTTEGFPFYVSYKAPLMMGQSAGKCVKELQIPKASPKAKRLGRGRVFPRRPRYVRERLPIPEREQYLHKLEAEALAAQDSERQAEKDS